jgi:hypothetical protein
MQHGFVGQRSQKGDQILAPVSRTFQRYDVGASALIGHDRQPSRPQGNRVRPVDDAP